MIDCTSLRDHEHPALADLSCEPTRTWVYDLKYPKPLPTVNWAYRREISQVHTGEGLLIQQAALAFEFWSGKLPDIAHFIHRD
jgi:shikimate 5-dehydrogenase